MTRQMFLWRFLAVAIPAILVVIGLHLADRATTLEKWQQHMETQVKKTSAMLMADFREASTDAMLLADDGLLQHQSVAALDMLAGRFISLARFHPHYQQIRFIDTSGMERLRVDSKGGKVWRVAENELQDKSGRDYFQEAVSLPGNSLRLSHLDLNIEHGKIERPLNPMLRFSVPVVSPRGKRLGVIVINYGVAPVLEALFNTEDPSGLRMTLLNAEGAWLGGGDEQDRWGGMLAHSRTFKQANPQAWAMMPLGQGESFVQWSSDRSNGATRRVIPTDFIKQTSPSVWQTSKISSADPYWLVNGQADVATILAPSYERLQVAIVLLVLGLALWAFVMRGWGKLKILSAAAMQQAHKLAKVVEQTTDHVLITDKDGRMDYVNPAFCHATGYEQREVIGENPRFLKSGQHPSEFYADMWKRIKQGETFQDLFINRRKNGMLYYEEKTIAPLHDEKGDVTHFVSTGKDITESKITRLAYYDPLTNLVNRVLFLDRLEHEIAHARRAKLTIAVMFLDLDGFKSVNDELGHAAGDKLLIEFARRVSELMRRSDTFARIGGDEFAVLLKEIKNESDAEDVANKILQAMQPEWIIDGKQVSIGVSIGISLYPSEEVDANGLLKKADQAMYQAKLGGRNRYSLYQLPTTEALVGD
ncbi:MAG: diguanylate cyclase [Gammaproteobacteria bacterium]|nr:diguanylate cyclase [Gammaproteobacteria bacterium]MBU1623698.1 diguanylate cyclase [Gammaproteobacteria bacterium]